MNLKISPRVELRRVLNDPVCHGTRHDCIVPRDAATQRTQRMQMKTKMEGVYALPDRCRGSGTLFAPLPFPITLLPAFFPSLCLISFPHCPSTASSAKKNSNGFDNVTWPWLAALAPLQRNFLARKRTVTSSPRICHFITNRVFDANRDYYLWKWWLGRLNVVSVIVIVESTRGIRLCVTITGQR